MRLKIKKLKNFTPSPSLNLFQNEKYFTSLISIQLNYTFPNFDYQPRNSNLTIKYYFVRNFIPNKFINLWYYFRDFENLAKLCHPKCMDCLHNQYFLEIYFR